jgi:alkylation response protein AidB-like acyl-CoA dehydrogenase
MDFAYTEEQRMLGDTVQRFVDHEYPYETYRRMAKGASPSSADTWRKLAELGLLGVPFESDVGGFGGGGVETMLVMEQLGRGLVLEPYFETVVLGGTAVDLGASAALRGELLARLIAGDLKLALAHYEPRTRYGASRVSTSARRDGDGYVVDGAKGVVLGAPEADLLVVSARTAGAIDAADGITLFLVERGAPGVTLEAYRTVDARSAAEVTLAGVRVGADRVLGEVDRGSALLSRVLDRANAALCAEAVGVMAALHAATVEYTKTRQQFGVPIARFQVLQHRMVDMLISLDQARSMAMLAAMKCDAVDPVERARAVSAAKFQIGKCGRYVGQQAIQLHGGMGMTDELVVGHWFKRLTAIDATLGDRDYHLQRFASLETAA